METWIYLQKWHENPAPIWISVAGFFSRPYHGIENNFQSVARFFQFLVSQESEISVITTLCGREFIINQSISGN